MPEVAEEIEREDGDGSAQLEAGRELLSRLFRTLGVAKLVVVDDDYEAGVGEDRFLEVLISLRRQEGDAPLELIGISVPDEDSWVSTAFEKIRSWDGVTRLKQWHLLRRQYPAGVPVGPLFTGNIADLTEGICDLVQLSPGEWDRQRNYLITEAEAAEKRETGRTLFLFDLDLADKHPRGLNGRHLLEELRTEIRQQRVLCGILSGKYNKEDEAEAAQAGGAINPPVYLAKERLDEEPSSFAYGVRRTAMVGTVAKVIAKAIDVLDSAQGQAKEELNKLNVNNFERVVLQISQQEGVWEADTIFRIFSIYHRKAARVRARGEGQLDQALEQMREIGGIGAGSASDDEPQELKRIQALEMYEEAEDLNPHFLPIELGDIFAIGNGEESRLFVLLGQPCDLSLRPPKTREDGEIGTRGFTSPWLVELVIHGKKGPDRNSLAAHYPLLYFREDLGPLWADFRTAKPTSLDVLDLCALNRTGQAYIDVAQGPPPGLLPAWALRFKELHEKYERELRRRDSAQAFLEKAELLSAIPEEIRQHLLGITGGALPILGVPIFEGTCIRFNCRRVRRLVQPHAGVLLVKFAHHISREAFDVDLGRDPKVRS